MTKQTKWWVPSKAVPPHLTAKAGKRDKGSFSDRAFWLGEQFYEAWFDTLHEVDKSRDLSPLIKQLKPMVPAEVYPHLVDLSKRYILKQRNRGKAPTPSYDLTAPEVLLELAISSVRDRRAERYSVKTALDKVSQSHSIPRTVLKNAYKKKRTSTRRIKQRRPKSHH
jgi:hypothetical protein